MTDPPRLDARSLTVRRQFDARAARFGDHDAIVREISSRMIERSNVMRIDARTVLDLGCGAGRSRAALAARFPGATWIGADLSESMLRQGRGDGARRRWWPWRRGTRRELWLCASAESLPLRDNSVDVVFSNLMLHWLPAPHAVFPELARVLRVGGLLIFSCFGPDTLKELRAACVRALPQARPMPYVDMHDFGDMMVAAGFASPVMEAETLRLTYRSARQLLTEARGLGGNPREDRARCLPSGRQARSLLEALASRQSSDGRIALTFEVAVGHGWKTEPRVPGVSKIQLAGLRDRLPRL
jgi:malonyl-CoA O-methyltransferase